MYEHFEKAKFRLSSFCVKVTFAHRPLDPQTSFLVYFRIFLWYLSSFPVDRVTLTVIHVIQFAQLVSYEEVLYAWTLCCSFTVKCSRYNIFPFCGSPPGYSKVKDCDSQRGHHECKKCVNGTYTAIENTREGCPRCGRCGRKYLTRVER